jgi:hypothetical protein
MRVHIFKASGELYGFTCAPSDNNLPADGGPWEPFKSIEVFEDRPAPRIGVNEADILAGINDRGFYLRDLRNDLFEPANLG